MMVPLILNLSYATNSNTYFFHFCSKNHEIKDRKCQRIEPHRIDSKSLMRKAPLEKDMGQSIQEWTK